MDLHYLQKEILNKESRKNGFSNWESMKICITEEHAKFIEEIVLTTLKEAKESMGQQGQQVLSKY